MSGSVTRNWISGREAVAHFELFCLQMSWVFSSVDGAVDFGKDGYVDLVENGDLTGTCFAVQIKGGNSYRRGNGYVIDATPSQRRQWLESTMPVMGIVWDPEDELFAWVDATATLASRGVDAAVRVPANHRLTGPTEIAEFADYVLRHAKSSRPLLELAGDTAEEQVRGVIRSFGLARLEPRAFVLIRRVMFSLSREGRIAAVFALAHLTMHPDIFWGRDNWVTPEVKRAAAAHLRWNVAETMGMLDLLEEPDFGRGTLGQSIYWILYEDPVHMGLVEGALFEALRTHKYGAAAAALLLDVFWAGEDGLARFEELQRRFPAVDGLSLTPALRESLRDWGYISID